MFIYLTCTTGGNTMLDGTREENGRNLKLSAGCGKGPVSRKILCAK